jgi:cytochrome P450
LLIFFYAGPDLLDLILAARGDDKMSKFTDEEIYEEAVTFGKPSFLY